MVVEMLITHPNTPEGFLTRYQAVRSIFKFVKQLDIVQIYDVVVDGVMKHTIIIKEILSQTLLLMQVCNEDTVSMPI